MAPSPVATAAAAPPLLPPGVTVASKGLSVRPCSALSVNQRRLKAGALLRPTITAPARRRCDTSGESLAATLSRKAGMPSVVAWPWVSTLTLIVTGTPCKGPTASPRDNAASAASALRRASSCITSASAFRRGLTASMRASTLAVASRQLSCRLSTRAASSVALRRQASEGGFMAGSCRGCFGAGEGRARGAWSHGGRCAGPHRPVRQRPRVQPGPPSFGR